MNIYEALSSHFGYKEFRPGQKEIIEHILNGENVIAVLPTGAGKSICYQIPALINKGFSIVVSPLIALMKDQVDSLNKKDEIAAFINSTMSFAEAEMVLQKISFGKIKLLYAAPERLEALIFAEKLKKLQPEFLFIDEAHCISEWGHNFRPSYTKLKEFISFTGIRNVSAFTATATPEVIQDIVKQLDIKEHKLFIRGFERDNLLLNVVTTKNKKSETLHLIKNHPGSAIIYTASRKQAEEITGFLNISKVSCEYYHAGVNPVIRRKIQEEFITGSLPVIAATNAFGMGIDKKDIRLIIHYNIPGSIENYYQEIGRAGRDGKPSSAYLLFDDKDIDIQNYFIESSHPDKTFIQQIYQYICDYGKVAEGNTSDKEIPVNMDFLSAVMQKEITKGMLHSALKLLEAGGYLKMLSEFDKKSFVQILVDKERLRGLIKRSINPVLKELIIVMIREFGSTMFNKRVQIDIDTLSGKSSLSVNDIDAALTQLDGMGLISYSRITGKENILLTSPRINPARLSLDYKKINENFLRFQNKLQAMVDYVFTNDCRFKYILSYFGENDPSYRCFKCDKCITVNKTTGMTREYVKELVLRTLHTSISLINETSLIKILTGKEKSASLQEIETFGSAANIERNEIKAALSELIADRKIERNRIHNKYLQLTSRGKEFLEKNKLTDTLSVSDYSVDLELFNLLREARSRVSKKFVQPQYIICPDDILRTIAEVKPKDKLSLLKIPGYNDRMFIKTGHEFLEIINSFMQEPDIFPAEKPVSKKGTLPKNIKETYHLLERKYSLRDIASLQKLSEAVVSMQVETILEYHPETEINNLYDKDVLSLIKSRLEEGITDLKMLKDSLPSDIPYSIIRIASAKFRVLKKQASSAAPQYEL
jgi:ATP-dependent DNA helicase RecQ